MGAAAAVEQAHTPFSSLDVAAIKVAPKLAAEPAAKSAPKTAATDVSWLPEFGKPYMAGQAGGYRASASVSEASYPTSRRTPSVATAYRQPRSPPASFPSGLPNPLSLCSVLCLSFPKSRVWRPSTADTFQGAPPSPPPSQPTHPTSRSTWSWSTTTPPPPSTLNQMLALVVC